MSFVRVMHAYTCCGPSLNEAYHREGVVRRRVGVGFDISSKKATCFVAVIVVISQPSRQDLMVRYMCHVALTPTLSPVVCESELS